MSDSATRLGIDSRSDDVSELFDGGGYDADNRSEGFKVCEGRSDDVSELFESGGSGTDNRSGSLNACECVLEAYIEHPQA